MLIRIPVSTTSSRSWHEITKEVKAAVAESGVQSGFCIIHAPHTTAALTITSFWDPAGLEDMQDEICKMVPTRIDFKHQYDTPQDAAGHVKSSLIGVGLTLIIDEGQLVLGHSQGIYLLEFDGPRKREAVMKIFDDAR